MKKGILYITIAFTACILFTGCLPEKDDTRLVYKGPTQVEFKNFTAGKLSSVLNNQGISTSAVDAQTDTTHAILIHLRTTDSLLVQLVGPQRSTPTVINYTVRSTSTAVEGTHYNFNPTGARSVTIPANSSSAYILVQPIAGSIAAGTSKQLIIDLVGGSGIPPSYNFKSFYDTMKP